jgi:predicted nucleotidyltransferase
LAASGHALALLLLLDQRPDGSRLAEAARALAIQYSSASRAMQLLAGDGLVTRDGHRYQVVESPRTRAAVAFGLAMLPRADTLRALSANPAVEFVGIDGDGAVVVLRRFAEPADEARLRRAVDGLHGAESGNDITLIPKRQLEAFVRAGDHALRTRAVQMRVLAGSVDRTFPDPQRRRAGSPTALQDLNAGFRPPSQRQLRRLAQRHGLRRIVAFGSATRDDFRPDSDVDLLVEPRAGRHLGLLARVRLAADAERMFDRDVDVVVGPARRDSLAHQIDREGVELYATQ